MTATLNASNAEATALRMDIYVRNFIVFTPMSRFHRILPARCRSTSNVPRAVMARRMDVQLLYTESTDLRGSITNSVA